MYIQCVEYLSTGHVYCIKLGKLSLTRWRHQMEAFPRYWPFVRGIHRSSVNSPHKGQWRGALMFSLMFSSICAWLNAWVNNREAGDLRRRRTHWYVIEMFTRMSWCRIQTYIHTYRNVPIRSVLPYSESAYCHGIVAPQHNRSAGRL